MSASNKRILTTEDSTEVILNCISDGLFTVDLEWNIRFFNRAAEEITGISNQEALGRPCCEVFRANICETGCAIRQTLKTGRPIINKHVMIMTSQGKQVPISISTALLKDKNGSVIGGVETFRDLSLVEELRKELRKQFSFEDIISKSPLMQQLFEIIPQIAKSDSTVLLEGESGTGKELIARAIHSQSTRKKGPLVSVNCGALPDNLLESELFGYVAGAFTDAKKDKPGRFALAQGGTIFLDEIGDISPALQVRLLRVLQEKEFEPLGGTHIEKADVRIIAASNNNIEKMVEDKTFRKDLYYRINVMKISLPSLRDRIEDLPLLVEHFIDRFNRIKGKDIAGIADDALAVLMHHAWPGNIRELENVIEYAFVLCSSGLVRIEHLPKELMPPDSSNMSVSGTTLEAIERRCIIEALKKNNGRKLATAQELGINKTTLWRKIKKLGIKICEEQP